ncbi:helix-turn-helix domain-containing protein [Lachnospiraceae bacterium SGI.085]
MKGVICTTERIYDRISKRASKKGISINSLEKQAGLAVGSVCKWNTVSPTVRNLAKVAKVLNCSLDDLTK